MTEYTESFPEKIPRHVAIIMDGNGRWARDRGLPRLMGHKVGTEVVKKVVTFARELGIEVLTLYAFSTENWKRPPKEVQALMGLLKSYLKAELTTMLRNGIELRCIGQPDALPGDVRKVLETVMADTRRRTDGKPAMVLNLALSYGGRVEIVQAARALAEECVQGHLTPGEISEELLAGRLFTAGLPDPDLVIRTGGEYRLSNFLLWQASYAELYFTSEKWPDFGEAEFRRALDVFQERERRYGKTGEQVQEGG